MEVSNTLLHNSAIPTMENRPFVRTDICVEGCSDNTKQDYIRCCLCTKWYHTECLALPSNELQGVWSCTKCRYIAEEVTEIRLCNHNLMKQNTDILNVVNVVKRSIDALIKKQNDMETRLTNKDQECHSLRQENTRLLTTVSECQRKLDSQTWSNKKVSSPQTLVIGTSLVKFLDEDKLVNTSVICKPGARLGDITKELESVPEGHNFHRLTIVGGGNDLSKDKPDEVIEKYKETIKAAKEIAQEVSISSIPPRLKPADFTKKVSRFNANLMILAEEQNCKFVDHQDTFYLRSGEVNTGFLDNDENPPKCIRNKPYGQIT